MARFSDIERAEELLAAKNQLETWRKLDRAAKQTAYAASMLGGRTNVGRQIGWIKPFGETNNFWFETKVLAAPETPPTPKEKTEISLINTLTGAIVAATGKRVSTTAPTGTNLVIKRARKIQFARVKVIVPGNEVRESRVSRFTGIKYRQREVNSVSCVFGMLDTETEQAAQNAIRASLKTALPTAIISFVPQGFVG